MKFITTLTFLISFCCLGQNCMSLFSYGANFETVSFFNQSSVPNAHYWWNFGDGTSSHFENPIHTYPETGKYFVTLFVLDTATNCSDYYELWLDLTKNSLETCEATIENSYFNTGGNEYMNIIDNSTNCNSYDVNYDFGPHANLWPDFNFLVQGSPPARYISRVQYYDPSIPNNLIREAYMSTPYNYSSNKNYGECSANFEYSVFSEDSQGQTILFKAMNKNAVNYEWGIIGFGAPIISYDDTVCQTYGFGGNYDMKIVRLYIEEENGCRDTMYQQVLIRPGLQTIVGLNEFTALSKKVIRIYDLLGRETEDKPNTLLIYVYSDGTTEKVFRIE